MKTGIKIVTLCIFLSFGFVAQAAHITVFNTVMTGDQANAGQGTGSTGKGAATMTLDSDTGLFSWFVAWENLVGDVTVAHFHGPATPDQNGGVQVVIDPSSNPTSGSMVLTADQIDDLLQGLWYINIHSTENPGGEIRGQVLALTPVPLPGAVWLFSGALIGLARIVRKG
ncbi:MAG: CHRD domain-containing protein [Gammaproteobacteria bacterium]